jgi:hypothetical protein
MADRQAFLPLTKYQTKILDENVIEKGFGEGIVRTFKRLQTLYGNKDHYAMNKNGDVAFENGSPYEMKRKPAIVNHKYTHDGVIYKYETRLIRR